LPLGIRDVVLLNGSCRLSYMPLGFGYVFEEKIAVHVAKIADNLRLRLSPRDSLSEIRFGCLIIRGSKAASGPTTR
jgi:hypothetical protein